MSPRAVWLSLALSHVLLLVVPRSVSIAYPCPEVCSCSAKTFHCTRDTQLASRAALKPGKRLTLSHLPLKMVPTFAFRDLVNITMIEISQSDSVTRIQRQAFLSLHTVSQIFVRNINSLQFIEVGAFTDLPKLDYLSISNTGLIHFPDFTQISSLAPRLILDMADNIRIHTIPANSFQGISKEYVDMNLVRNGFRVIQAHAFNGTNLNSLILRDNKFLTKIDDNAFGGASGPTELDVSSTSLSALPHKGLRQMKELKASSAYALKTLPPLEGLSEILQTAELTYPSHCCAFHNWRRKQRESLFKNMTTLCDLIDMEPSADGISGINDINFQYPDLVLDCSNSPYIKCTPKPDAFNPCEDLLGFSFLRCLSWVITIFAVAGNLAVLTGPGCGIAGFLTVFASELSVYTLTVISLERWHTITNAMHVNKRLKMHHVAAMMGAGWAFSLLVALLPLVGVSSYSKVSICLPMDIDTIGSQMYVVAVLIVNVVAFVVVCYCYVCIYISVHNPEHSTRNGDTKIAKRMAVLIFTDFLCMAPISFFAISAALKMPLITVSHSKILLILFYPINSLCNPFLYTIFTRAFRKDVCLLLGRCGCCPSRAEYYRSQTIPSHLSNGQKTANGKSHSLNFYAYHLKMKGCFLSKGTT
ncbi:hypothetical protein WMY93_018944 [Mugilogobius chulae]|uniref:G-protein coupled receptors family 1 profile domain-containing protein n=1 Tax=Mugilogobius chulae TaxID=88201 RepID=A0AAW0NVI4_9GOBI